MAAPSQSFAVDATLPASLLDELFERQRIQIENMVQFEFRKHRAVCGVTVNSGASLLCLPGDSLDIVPDDEHEQQDKDCHCTGRRCKCGAEVASDAPVCEESRAVAEMVCGGFPKLSDELFDAVTLLGSSTAQPMSVVVGLPEKGNISAGVREKEHDCPAKQLQGGRDNSDSSEERWQVPMLPFLDEAGQFSHVASPLEHILDKIGLRKMQEPAFLKASCLQPHEGRLKLIADSHWFKVVSAVMIMLNYYFIVHQTDFKMSHLGQDEPPTFFVIEVLFTAFYVGEITCQVLAYRKEYFLGHDMHWNMFDLFIVLVSVFELVVNLMGGKAINLSFLKVLRFLKISRVLRMFSALRLMKEIRIMVDALAGSFLIFVFCSIMFAMFFSIFAIFFVQGMTSYLEATADVDQQVLLGIKGDFGSVSTTMLSLFMAVTGGNDWTQYHETVAAVGTTYNFLFVFFIGFSTISFLNVITGVFAEKAMSLAAPTVEELMLMRTKKEKTDARELVNLLHLVLGSDTHVLGHESLETLLDHPQVVGFLETRGLKPSSARRFFMLLLEIHQTSTVDFGTFVSGCVKFDGSASSIDLHVLSAELKSMQLRQHHQSQDLKASLEKINTCMEGLAICDETIEPSLTSVMPQSSNDGSGSSAHTVDIAPPNLWRPKTSWKC